MTRTRDRRPGTVPHVACSTALVTNYSRQFSDTLDRRNDQRRFRGEPLRGRYGPWRERGAWQFLENDSHLRCLLIFYSSPFRV